MKILFDGPEKLQKEVEQKFSHAEKIDSLDSVKDVDFNHYDLILDLKLDYSANHFNKYEDADTCIFISGEFNSLNQKVLHNGDRSNAVYYSINSLPTFINRKILEIGALDTDSTKKLEGVLGDMEFELVEDRIGLVTPRVICMIINEAYYTVQEGTASKQDIDIAMKLGTNYPLGPFEWSEKIGIHNVYHVLQCVYNDTRDDRYKICPMLKREFQMTNG